MKDEEIDYVKKDNTDKMMKLRAKMKKLNSDKDK
jgi:hypothetical protein